MAKGNRNAQPPKRKKQGVARRTKRTKRSVAPALETVPLVETDVESDEEELFPRECRSMDDALECALYGAEADRISCLDERRARRISICYYFKFVLHEPPQEEWDGKGGAIPTIRHALRIPPRTDLKSMLLDFLEHERTGVEYKGDRINGSTLGRPPILTTDSVEAHIVADSIEDGLSVPQTTLMCNEHRRQEGQSALTEAPVYTLVKKLKPKVSSVKKRKQGKKDVDSPWSKGRYRFTTQLLVRFEILRAQKKDDGTVPDYWNPDKLESLKKTQVSHWDETHKKCTIGGIAAGTVGYQVKFPRDENGKLDLSKFFFHDVHCQLCLYSPMLFLDTV